MHTPVDDSNRQELLGKCWETTPVDDPSDDWWNWI